jgi:hypothetical protein
MPEIFRTRDVVVLFKGDAYSVAIDPAMRANGWAGGQGVRWVNSPRDEFMVSYSDGLYGGFLLWGSDEDSDKYTAMTEQQPTYGYAIMCAGGWLISTPTFEWYTYASRTGGGPLVRNSYVVGERLVFSLRGLFTREDEWSLAGDPRAPNQWYVASVVQVPTAANNWYMTLQTSI